MEAESARAHVASRAALLPRVSETVIFFLLAGANRARDKASRHPPEASEPAEHRHLATHSSQWKIHGNQEEERREDGTPGGEEKIR
ncbi:hypothetical protein GCM10017673_16270 [Streptosporangium violaceochromogenes]|nr:hypothetical protein GCM10017673_16270 [Streptosporangium violaceochromogenes]